MMANVVQYFALTTCVLLFGNASLLEKGEGDVSAAIINVVNVVLDAAVQTEYFVVIITESTALLDKLSDVSAPRGVAGFQVATTTLGTNKKERQDISSVVTQISRKVSSFLSMIVISDDPTFLRTFTWMSLEAQILVWSTRLIIVTRHPDTRQLQDVRTTLMKTNSILLYLTPAPGTRWSAYSQLPYSDPNDKLQLVASWNTDQGLTFLTKPPVFFPDKFKKMQRGPRLLVSHLPFSTSKKQIVADPTEPSGQRILYLDHYTSILEAVAPFMNFSTRYVTPADKKFGLRNPNGSWTGMMGMTQRQEVDIGVGPLAITTERVHVVDFTTPVTVMYGRLVVGLQPPEVDPSSFLKPLTWFVWVGLLMALGMLLVTVNTFIFCLPTELQKENKSMHYNFNFIRVMLLEDIRVAGWRWCERVLLGVWMMTMVVMTLSYAGNLMSLLAVRYVPQPIHSLQDVTENPVVFMSLEGVVRTRIFMTANSGLYRKIGDLRHLGRLQTYKPPELGLMVDTLVTRGTHVLMTADTYAQMAIAEHFTKTGQCVLYLGREEFMPLTFAMVAPKGSPLVPALNNKIQRVIEGGLMDYWRRQFTPNFTTCLNPPKTVLVKTKLDLAVTWGIFMVLAGGVAAALIVLALERLSFRLQQ